MKYFYLLLILIASNLIAQPFMSEKEFQMMKEADPNYGIERRKWMEDMHRTAPNVDYKLLNQHTRELKHAQKKEIIEQRFNNNSKKPQIQSDTIAGGKIIGEWIERGSNNLAGRMLTCDIDWETGLLYNASSGGNIWRGTLEGEDWTCLNNGFQLTDISLLKVFKVDDKKRIFVATGNRCFYSDNEGLTWTRSKGLDKVNSIRRAVMTNDESKITYITGNENINSKKSVVIYKSEDFGLNFSFVYAYQSGNNFFDLWTPKYEKPDVYFVHYDTLSKVNSDGSLEKLSNIKIDSNFSVFNQLRISGSVKDNQTTIAMFLQNKSNNYCHFYSTTNLGAVWATLGVVDYGPFSNNSFEVSSVYPEAMYFGGVNCSRSHDYGKTWQIVNTWGEYYGNIEKKLHADLPAITSFRNPEGEEVLIISTDGGSYISYDNLLTVQNISLSNLNVSQYYGTYSYRPDPDIIFVGSQDQGFQRTTSIAKDKTHSFEQTISGDYGHLTSSDGGKTLWCVYPGFTMLYKNLATPSATSRTSLDFDKNGSGGLWMRPVLADPKDPNIAYLAGGKKDGFYNIWKLEYKGGRISGEQMPYQFSANDVVSALGISDLNQDLFYAMTNNGEFFYSLDRGINWTKSEGFAKLGGHYFYGASIAPSNVDANTVYIAGSGYSNPGAYVSYDHGITFTPIDSGLPKTLVYRIAVSDDDKFIFAATAVGPYVYVKDEGKWFDLGGVNAPDQTFWCVEYIPSISTARFGTYGRGIWDFFVKGASSLETVALIAPADASENNELELELVWTLLENADSYHLQISKDNKFSKIIFEDNEIVTNQMNLEVFFPNTTYYWRIKAQKGELKSSWSEVYSFSTKPMVPSIPSLNYPKNDEQQVDILPTFEWEKIPYATHYQLQCSESDKFDILAIDNKNIPSNSYEDEYFFEEGVTYFWRVKALINDVEGEFSTIWKFKTQMPAPETPILLEPKFGASGVPLNLTLVWSEIENTDYYSLELASDNKFANKTFTKDSIYWYSFKFNDELASSKIYFWRVKANNMSGSSDWSEFGMFVTGSHIDVTDFDKSYNFIISPNPFNNELNLGLELSELSDISISIYDLLGKEILKVTDGNFESGNYTFKITKNQLCESCSSNIFIIKLNINGQLITRKVSYLP
jgi:hypothetical protein